MYGYKNALKEIETEIKKRGIPQERMPEYLEGVEELKNRRIIAGYASVAVVDREGHKITIPALKDAVKSFMEETLYRPINVFHCLAPNTKILACKRGNRYVPISEIKVGDRVYSHTGKLNRVNEVFTYPVNSMVNKLELANGETIFITDEHPVLTRDRGWVKAKDLLESDILLHVQPLDLAKGSSVIKDKWGGRTYEEIFGVMRAKEIGEKNSNKGLTLSDLYGKEKATEILLSLSKPKSCSKKNKNRTFELVNGTSITHISRVWYTGWVYNLDVEGDHTYVGRGVVFHNSDVTVGRVLYKWTNPETGMQYRTQVDDRGWFVVCLVPETQIRTTTGYKKIEDIKVGEKVYTHLCGKAFPVLKTMSREISEEIVVLYLGGNNVVKVTKEHPILTKTGWKKAGEIERGDVLLHLIDTTNDDRSKYKECYNKMRNTIREQKIILPKPPGLTGKFRPVYLDLKEYQPIKHAYQKNVFTKNNFHTYKEAYGEDRAKEIGLKKMPYSLYINNLSRKEIIEIRGSNCEVCGKTNLVKYDRQVHHLDENKFNNSLDNVMVLCAKCHSATKTHNNQFMNLQIKANKNVRFEVYERDNYKCVNCGDERHILAHHFQPKDTLDSMVTLCKKCHLEAHRNKSLLPVGVENGTVVKLVSREFYTGLVYNLEVEKANSYAGRGIIFHNCELRGDIEIANKVWEEVEKGNIKSFSIAGSSKDKEQRFDLAHGVYYDINRLELYEITLCEEPVNQMSKFQTLWNPDRTEI